MRATKLSREWQNIAETDPELQQLAAGAKPLLTSLGYDFSRIAPRQQVTAVYDALVGYQQDARGSNNAGMMENADLASFWQQVLEQAMKKRTTGHTHAAS